MNICFIPSSILRIKLLRGFLLATQGSIMASDIAMNNESKAVIHVGGGFHHAHFKGGSGFCVYNDIGLTCKYLLEYYGDKINKILVIDLDAHQGDGIGKDKEILGDRIVLADIYNNKVYPQDEHAEEFIDYKRFVTKKDSSSNYLEKLESLLSDIKR